MTKILLKMESLERMRDRRPPGYTDEVLALFTPGAETLELDRDVWAEIVRRHRPEPPPAPASAPAAEPSKPKREQRPKVTLAAMASYTRALLGGEYVGEDTRRAREAICASCDKVREDIKGMWCGVCGCGVGVVTNRMMALTAYAENLPHWGCKHPKRGKPKDAANPDGPKYGWPVK